MRYQTQTKPVDSSKRLEMSNRNPILIFESVENVDLFFLLCHFVVSCLSHPCQTVFVRQQITA
jgi:hypothetical protein